MRSKVEIWKVVFPVSCVNANNLLGFKDLLKCLGFGVSIATAEARACVLLVVYPLCRPSDAHRGLDNCHRTSRFRFFMEVKPILDIPNSLKAGCGHVLDFIWGKNAVPKGCTSSSDKLHPR